MKSTEFSGFICDGCGKPVTVEQAEFKMVHFQGNIIKNNTADEVISGTLDFHNRTCFIETVKKKFNAF